MTPTKTTYTTRPSLNDVIILCLRNAALCMKWVTPLIAAEEIVEGDGFVCPKRRNRFAICGRRRFALKGKQRGAGLYSLPKRV